jgi:hypothetical protein
MEQISTDFNSDILGSGTDSLEPKTVQPTEHPAVISRAPAGLELLLQALGGKLEEEARGERLDKELDVFMEDMLDYDPEM